jgi:DNA-binding transcriptional LysR family regulator
MLQHSELIAVLPRMLTHEHMEHDTLSILPFVLPSTHPVGIITRRGSTISPSAAYVLDTVRAVAKLQPSIRGAVR